MDIINTINSPMFNIIALCVGLLVVGIGYVGLKAKFGSYLVRVQEDLANEYTPEILKPVPLEKEQPAQETEEPKEEVAAEEE